MTTTPRPGRRAWAILLGLGAFLSVAALPAAEIGEGWAGVEVTAVELRTDREPVRREELAASITVSAGQPLDADAVRASLRYLQASGEVGAVEAWALGVPGGVHVVFSAYLKLRVEAVRIEGVTELPLAELRRRLVQRPGEALSESRVVRGVYRLQDLYADRGYPLASVRVAVEPAADPGRVSVLYRVDAGPPAMVESVAFDGSIAPFEAAQLIERLRLRPGTRYRRQAARDDATRLEEWLLAEGYRQATLDRPRRSNGTVPPDVALTFPIRVGPRFAIHVEGADAKRLRRRGAFPLDRERFDEALLAETVDKVRAHFQGLGHYRVEVTVEEERGPERVELTVRVVPGPVFGLTELELAGNEWAASERLEQLLTTTPRRLLGSARLVDRTLEADLANLRAFYALEGFRQAVVGPPEVEESGGELRLRIPIVEGPRQLTGSVGFEGRLSFDGDLLDKAVALAPGGPYHPRLLQESIAGLRATYEEEGYPSTQVTAGVEWNEARSLAAVTFHILEGPRAVVDRVIVRGNLRTRAGLIRRAIGLSTGDVVNTRRLLRGQRRLLRLGVFSRAEVRLGPAPPFTSRRDLIVEVEEGKAIRVGYGLGWDSEDGPRGLLRLSRVNLAGRALTARLDLRVSDREQQARALLQQPFLGRHELPTTFSLFFVEEAEESFDSKRRGLQVRTDYIGETFDLRLIATYKLVEVENADPALKPLEIERDLREVEVASLSPGLLVDRRDDPLNATRGWTASLQAEYAFPAVSARTRFLKLFGQQTIYLPLGPWGTAAASVRVGAIEPIAGGGFEDTTLPEGLESRDIPISERYFAGGRSTHRAYKRDRLGIPGQTLLFDPNVPEGEPPGQPAAVGGNGLLLVNLDYRFPIAGPVGGLLFADAGNVWAGWRRIDPSEMKTGVGTGVRYLSPIGPLRLEVGWKLDRDPGEPRSVVFLSFGDPF